MKFLKYQSSDCPDQRGMYVKPKTLVYFKESSRGLNQTQNLRVVSETTLGRPPRPPVKKKPLSFFFFTGGLGSHYPALTALRRRRIIEPYWGSIITNEL